MPEKKRKKPAGELTTDEIARRLFPKTVRKEAAKKAEEASKKRVKKGHP